MGAVKTAVPADHLRLEPQAEFHSHVPDFTCQPCYPIGQLMQVGIPVPQGSGVIVPLSKPPVIQHEQLYAQLPCLVCNGENLFLVKIHVCGFPVINQDGPFPVPPIPPGKPGPVELVERLTHAV